MHKICFESFQLANLFKIQLISHVPSSLRLGFVLAAGAPTTMMFMIKVNKQLLFKTTSNFFTLWSSSSSPTCLVYADISETATKQIFSGLHHFCEMIQTDARMQAEVAAVPN